MEQINRLMRFPAALGVEIQAPRRETAHFQKNEHDFGSVVNIGRELIGIPAEKLVAGVRID